MKIFVQLGTLITFVECSQNDGASIMVLQNKAHSTPVYFKISMAGCTIYYRLIDICHLKELASIIR